MSLNEDAAMAYNPDDDEQPTAQRGSRASLAAAERQLSQRPGVNGMGMSKTPSGQDAIIVYVDNEQTRSSLPSDVEGTPVIGEVTGQIRAY
ncbi:hypothetical protein [Roseimaritima ulvae]|uniref:Uncharacterized protein n=1 Tax=Roseimaritima ulvae TaxID=980254 RepID=A0A5B9QH40_9BACT|nr:hypothetical protein [Roseimaritima ulvae]QEG38134.1 hypothetical protein UC8_00870 [Roseimaritima ulvae]